MKSSGTLPLLLFGAFDRHNFGDMLFPHLMTALLPGHAYEYVGLAGRDLTAFGGQRVRPLAEVVAEHPAHLIHVGGEILACDAYQSAVMLLGPGQAKAAIARYDNDPLAAAAWAARQLGTSRRIPYVAGNDGSAGLLIFNAVGGVEWTLMTPAQRDEVKAALACADWVSVRDDLTQSALLAEGIPASLCPDPAVMLQVCFGALIRQRQQQGEVKSVREHFAQGYMACQFSVDFGNDTSLDALAQAFSTMAAETGLGLVLFRAGAAPWHDDPDLYEKVRRKLHKASVHVFRSLGLWDICALIAASRGVVSSSLHGRIVALAYGLPRVSLASPQQAHRPDKVAAFAETWEPEAIPRSVELAAIEPAIRQALMLPAGLLRQHAADLCERYRQSLAQWTGRLEDNACLVPPADETGHPDIAQ